MGLGSVQPVYSPMLSLPVEILIVCLLVLANGLLAMAETAVVSARKGRLRELAAKNDTGAAKAHPAFSVDPATLTVKQFDGRSM